MLKKISYSRINGETQIYFQSLNKWFIKKNLNSKIIIVDKNVYRYHKSIIDNFNVPVFIYSANELNKSYNWALRILNFFYQHQVDRGTLVMVIGGGNTCDIGAFATSIWKRGCLLMLVPTTLLAMVDAAIGGKTAINFKNIKNSIGTFFHPNFVIIDTSLLKTLPKNIFIQGIPEMVKHAITLNSSLYEKLQKQTNILENQLQDLIMQNIQTKLKVVLNDAFENNERKILNFGHTVGHALEMAYNMPHGEAIAKGMLLEAYTLYTMRIWKDYEIICSLKTLLNRLFPKNKSLKINFDEIKPYILHDKKKNQNDLVLAVVEEIGKAKLVNIKYNDFLTALKETTVHENKS